MRINRLFALLLFVASPVFCRQTRTEKTLDPSSRDKVNAAGTSVRTSEIMNVNGSSAAYPDEEEYSRAARLYLNGLYAEASVIFEMACNNLNAKACTDLGVMYRWGQGVKRNYPRAAALDLQGCDGGNGLGCTNLGLMHWNNVLPKDDERSTELFERGCNEGDNNGCRVLGFMYEKGLGVPRDVNRAALFCQKSREHRIPFEVKDGLILIKTTFDSAHVKLIVDTGGTTAFGIRFVPPTRSPYSPTRTLESVHGTSQVYPITVVWSFDGQDKRLAAVAGALTLPNDADGILGADILETFKSARFDFQTSLLILEDIEVPEGVAGSDILGAGHAQ